MSSEKPLVFISCGQYTESEKRFGKNICLLLEQLRPDVAPYFAEDQSTVEGLSNQILKSLHRAAGFVCVMHARGTITTPDKKAIVRGSVWVEQEIAITAFMNHVLDRSIPTLFYKEAGVNLEGIRSVLLLNPRVEFTEESQILDDLKLVLPSTAFTPFNAYDIVPIVTYRRTGGGGDRHTYSLIADVKNVGSERITDFQMRVFFPRAFLNPSTSWDAEDRARSSPSHICFTADALRAPGGLYPGDTLRNPLTVEYFVDHDLDDDPGATNSEIVVELFSGSMKPKKQTYKIRDFLEF